MVLSRDPEAGGFTASCPAMPGAASQGETRDETLANMAEAMAAWMDAAEERGTTPLPETANLIANEVAFVLGWRAEEGWDLAIETTVIPTTRLGRTAA